ncbi:exonuclease domain-containing protein [Streptomyces sp. NPDC021056]|uniref:exonuclease domain-containing protein n=1 Tax=Streptomyces sp. NPDC021056 TaxID=3155012 RepID=UPI003406DFF5
MASTAPATTEALPVYARSEVPEHLRTMTQLKQDRLKPAEGQQPVALVRVYRSGHGWGEFPLYDPAEAAKMRPLSAKQQRAKEDRRTCPECSTVCTYIVYQRCEDCRRRAQQEAQDRQARTCHRCRRESDAQLPKDVHGWWACEHCRIHYTIRQQAEEERRATWSRTCPGHPRPDLPHYDCTAQTATDGEVDAQRSAGTWNGPRRCPSCADAFEQWRTELKQRADEAEQRAKETRRRQLAELAAWAREVLADPDVVVLDTETTGLGDHARIVELAAYTVAGKTLLDTLVHPGEPIPEEASDIHGITDAWVATAPTFAEILPGLTEVLKGRRCLIYNASYDVGRLSHELTLHYRQTGHDDPEAAAKAWLKAVHFEDVMLPYSEWYGEWSDYWGEYAWQPLYGGDHRALGDCQAVVDRLREMAAGDDDDQ